MRKLVCAALSFACAAALATIAELDSRRLCENAFKMGEYLGSRLEEVAGLFPEKIKLTRGLGLMRAVLFAEGISNADVCSKLRANGLILIPAGANALRFLPPLNVKKPEIDAALRIFKKTLSEL